MRVRSGAIVDLYDRVITPAIKGDHALYLHFTLACILSPHIAVLITLITL